MSRLNAYQQVAAHGGVAASDPHGLVLMLMNGALERMAKARGCIANKAFSQKAQLLHRAISIIDELRNSLNLQAGGELAANLDGLYEYMCTQLLSAMVENSIPKINEVMGLLQNIRDAWDRIPKEQRKLPGAA